MQISRRQFIQIGTQVAAVAATSRFFVTDAFAATSAVDPSVLAQLDRFVEQYMRDMNAPGMTLVIADRDGVKRIATYGFDDLELRTPIAVDGLFQIGSISKSFIANCLLQLRDEGKLDLDRTIADYLPWMRVESPFAPITIHHLLTHTSGLPGNAPLFLSDPLAKHRAANPPGQYFHYCNMAFEALGHLLSSLDGRSIGESIRQRVLEPLGMTQSEPVISFDHYDRVVTSYWPTLGDRPYPRYGKLSQAPGIISTDGAGCVNSTARDMGLYIQMLANGGKGPRGRLLSEDGFAKFSTAYIKAAEFGPSANYGYGIVVDQIDGHKTLRHTGGMVSFASALQVDLEDGIGAFASINAMQFYRPVPVVEYAVSLVRAQRASKPLLVLPPRNDPDDVESAQDCAGVFHHADGRSLEFVADGKRLFLVHAGQRVAVDAGGLVRHPDFARFALAFGRANPKDEKSPVVEVGWGSDWYTNANYSGPTRFVVPAAWHGFEGHYHSDNPWVGSFHVLIFKDKLTIDGAVPLEASDDVTFWLRDEEHSPEWIRFGDIVDGRAMRVKYSGDDLWRVMTA